MAYKNIHLDFTQLFNEFISQKDSPATSPLKRLEAKNMEMLFELVNMRFFNRILEKFSNEKRDEFIRSIEEGKEDSEKIFSCISKYVPEYKTILAEEMGKVVHEIQRI